MSFNQYYYEVEQKANDFGYDAAQVALFHADIYECYLDGKSVNECLEEVF